MTLKLFVVNINGCWKNNQESRIHTKWIKDAWNSIRQFAAGGVYVNFLSDDDGEDRVQEAYKGSYKSLISLKSKYDPENFFRNNQNIKPLPEKEKNKSEVIL